MRCLGCGRQMRVTSVTPVAPTAGSTLIPGFERPTLKCLRCGEERLLSGHSPDLAAKQLSASRADCGQQDDTAHQAQPLSVSAADSVQPKHAATPKTFAQKLEKLQQRCLALEQESARDHSAKAARRSAKAATAKSLGEALCTPPMQAPTPPLKGPAAMSLDEAKEFDRLWDSLVPPPLPRTSSAQQMSQPEVLSKRRQPDSAPSVPRGSEEHQDQTPRLPATMRDGAASSAPLELQDLGKAAAPNTGRVSVVEAKDFDRLWDSLVVRTPPPLPPTSSAQQMRQSDALKQTPQADFVPPAPKKSGSSEEHQDQTPRLPATTRDSAAPSAPLELQDLGKPEAPNSAGVGVAEAEDFDRLWDSQIGRTPPPPTPSAPQMSQPDALSPTPQPDFVPPAPKKSVSSEEHQDQTPKLLATMRDSAAPSSPLELQDLARPEVPNSAWVRLMAMLLPTRVRK
jgi:hypothetical protein